VKKHAAKSERRDDRRADCGSDGPRERPAGAKDADGAVGGMKAGAVEVPFDERDRLGKGRRANRNRDRRDEEQDCEIGREGERSVPEGGPGESQEQRPDACLLVDPRSKPRGEGDSAERSRGQNGAQQEGAEARLIDEKEHDVGAGDGIREASEHVDDDKRDEESRTIDVRCQEGPRYCRKACR
jgi:hypothetical protein